MASFEELLRTLTNWGRWGADDERGALNYVTPDVRRRAAGCVRQGKTFSLVDPDPPRHPGPQGGVAPHQSAASDDGDRLRSDGARRPRHERPLRRRRPRDDGAGRNAVGRALPRLLRRAALERLPRHHRSTRAAPHRGGIDKVHGDFVSRGVLLDVARAAGRRLPAGRLRRSRRPTSRRRRRGRDVRVERGRHRPGPHRPDVDRRATSRTGRASAASEAGLHWETAAWLHDRRVAAVAADNSMVEAEWAAPRRLGAVPHARALQPGPPPGRVLVPRSARAPTAPRTACGSACWRRRRCRSPAAAARR